MGRYNYTKALEKLTAWAYEEGYEEIIFDHTDVSYIDWKKKTLNEPRHIKIEGKYSIEIKVYLLLHELGHHQLRKDWGEYERLLPALARAEEEHVLNNDIRYKRRNIYFVSCMEEEFKAWDEGFNLAVDLDIRINEDKWNEFKSKCLLSYMKFYSKKVN